MTRCLSDSHLHLRLFVISDQFGQLPSSLAPGSQVEQQIMIECMKPSDIKPSLCISYKESGGAIKKNEFLLPLHMTLFNDPLSISGEDFNKRWQMLGGAGQEAAVCIIKQTPLSAEQANEVFEKVQNEDGCCG